MTFLYVYLSIGITIAVFTVGVSSALTAPKDSLLEELYGGAFLIATVTALWPLGVATIIYDCLKRRD